MATAPQHWHCAITQPLADDLRRFCTSFSPEALPTQAAARQKLAAPIRAAHESLGPMSPYGALAEIAGIWTRQQEPYLLIPEVAVFAVCPCNGDHAAAEQAHLNEIMHRAATHGNPFTATRQDTRAARTVPPSRNLTPPNCPAPARPRAPGPPGPTAPLRPAREPARPPVGTTRTTGGRPPRPRPQEAPEHEHPGRRPRRLATTGTSRTRPGPAPADDPQEPEGNRSPDPGMAGHPAPVQADRRRNGAMGRRQGARHRIAGQRAVRPRPRRHGRPQGLPPGKTVPRGSGRPRNQRRPALRRVTQDFRPAVSPAAGRSTPAEPPTLRPRGNVPVRPPSLPVPGTAP